MFADNVWTILYSAPEEGPKSTTGDLSPVTDVAFGRPMLERALECALQISAPERLLLPLLEAEQPWWQSTVAHLPSAARLAQPLDRGSGIGLLVALVHIARVDPEAPVVIFTSDNVCWDAEALAKEGLSRLTDDPRHIQVVGRTPTGEAPAHDLWVVPEAPGSRAVSGFVFSPSEATRHYLLGQGGVLATPVVVAKVSALLTAYEMVRPDVVEQCVDALGADQRAVPSALDALYPFVDALDFHREVLAVVPERLALAQHGAPEARAARIAP